MSTINRLDFVRFCERFEHVRLTISDAVLFENSPHLKSPARWSRGKVARNSSIVRPLQDVDQGVRLERDAGQHWCAADDFEATVIGRLSISFVEHGVKLFGSFTRVYNTRG